MTSFPDVMSIRFTFIRPIQIPRINAMIFSVETSKLVFNQTSMQILIILCLNYIPILIYAYAHIGETPILSSCHDCSYKEKYVVMELSLARVLESLQGYVTDDDFDHERFMGEHLRIHNSLTLVVKLWREIAPWSRGCPGTTQYASKTFYIMRNAAVELTIYSRYSTDSEAKMIVGKLLQVHLSFVSLPLKLDNQRFLIDALDENATRLAHQLYELKAAYFTVPPHEQATVSFEPLSHLTEQIWWAISRFIKLGRESTEEPRRDDFIADMLQYI